MKMSKIALATLLTSSLLVAGASVAKSNYFSGDDIERKVVKVKMEHEEGVKVFIGQNGDKKQYSFDLDELENLDNIRAELGDVDQETLDKVMHILEQVNEHDGKVIEIKDAYLNKNDNETSIYVVKSSNEPGQMHIEMDIEGDEKVIQRKFHFLDGGKGHKRDMKKRMKWHMENGDGSHVAKIVKKLINNSELTDEQIAEIRTALDEKEAN